MVDVLTGNSLEVLKTLPSGSVQCCITSPPYYGLRDYGVDGQFGQEESPEKFIDNLVNVFREVRRILKDGGTLWVNIGDSYCGTASKGEYRDPKYKDGRNGQAISKTQNVENCKHKDLIGIPWMLAFALRGDGWYLRQDIIWSKPNAMPESVKDRFTKSHEYVFLLSKNKDYYFDHEAMQETSVNDAVSARENPPRYGGKKYTQNPDEFFRTKSGNAYAYTGRRNRRDVWTISTQPCKNAHFAVFPEKLVEPCILAASKEGDTVLDPFGGSGTTGVVANRLGRHAILIDINPEYVELAKSRTNQIGLADVMV